MFFLLAELLDYYSPAGNIIILGFDLKETHNKLMFKAQMREQAKQSSNLSQTSKRILWGYAPSVLLSFGSK